MSKDCEQTVVGCEVCKYSDGKQRALNPKLSPIPWPEGPWQTLAIDIVGPFAPIRGQRRLFVISLIDLYSKWPEVLCTETCPTTRDVIGLLEEAFGRFGSPERVISDNGSQFVSREMDAFLRAEKVQHVRTTPYYPMANGQIERFNAEIGKAMREASGDRVYALRKYVRTYRLTPHSTTEVAPAQLLLGRLPRNPLTALLPRSHQSPEVESDVTVRARVEGAQEKMRKLGGSQEQLLPGTEVMARRLGPVPKGEKKWRGPQNVEAEVGPNTYRLDDGTRVAGRNLARVRKGALSKNENAQDGKLSKAAVGGGRPGTLPVSAPVPVAPGASLRRSSRRERRQPTRLGIDADPRHGHVRGENVAPRP